MLISMHKIIFISYLPPYITYPTFNNNKNRRHMKVQEKYTTGDKASIRARVRYNREPGTVRQGI